jgi:hypothetical protein
MLKGNSVFLEKIKKHMKADGKIIIVECYTENLNPWIPYPTSFDNLCKSFGASGFNHMQKIGERVFGIPL